MRELDTDEPTCSPMGVIARSVPSVNRPMPTISSTVPMTKDIRMLLGTGMMLKQRINRMAATGRTDLSASASFLSRMVLCLNFI